MDYNRRYPFRFEELVKTSEETRKKNRTKTSKITASFKKNTK